MPSYTSQEIVVNPGERSYHCIFRRRQQGRIRGWLQRLTDTDGLDVLRWAVTHTNVHVVVRIRRPGTIE